MAPPPRPSSRELVVLGMLLLGFLVLAVFLVQGSSALGHDESLYGVRAREIATGEPRATWFAGYRAPGLPWTLAWLPIGSGAGRFRMVVAGFGCLGIVATWVLGRTTVGVAAGLVAAALVAVTPAWLLNATLLLPDVAGAAVGVTAMAVLAVALTRPELPGWAWLVVPLGMAATWIRFGAPLVIAVGLTTMVLAAWRRLRHQLQSLVALGVATAAAMAAILLVPGMIGHSESAATAIREYGADRPNDLATTLGDFWSLGPNVLGTTLRWALAAAGLAALAFLVTHRGRAWHAGPLWAGAATVLTVLGLGVTLGHGEGRYLAPVLPLLWVAAAAALTWTARRVPLVAAGLAMTALVVATAASSFSFARMVHDHQDDTFDLLRVAGAVIRTEPNLPCPVVTSYTPQVEWYSGCDTIVFDPGQLATDPLPSQVVDDPFSIVLVQDGKRQPEPEVLAPWLDSAAHRTELDEGGDGGLERIELYGVARRPAATE